MKKIILTMVMFCFIAGMTLPTMAMDIDFSGSSLEMEGILNSNTNMNKNDLTSDFRQMRLRINTTITVSDELKLTTRFDALEKLLSSNDSAFVETMNDTGIDADKDDDNIDFDRAYLTWKSPIGLFQIGRMEGITWGTSFADDESDTDRIKYILPIPMKEGSLYIAAVAEKVTENDKDSQESDADNDKFYIGVTYKTQNYASGLLTAFYNYKTYQDPSQIMATNSFANVYRDEIEHSSMDLRGAITNYSAALTGYGTALAMDGGAPGANVATFISANPDFVNRNALLGEPVAYGGNVNDPMNVIAQRGGTSEAKFYLLAPYFEGTFGDFSVSTELDYMFGTNKYDSADDCDISTFAYFFEGHYDFGPAEVQLGFAHAQGDADYMDDKIEFLAPGADWAKVFILNDDAHGMNTTLAGVGNHVGDGIGSPSIAMYDGYQMIYAGVDYAVTDSITIGLIAAISKADDIPDGMQYDDDQGIEYDLSFTWKLTKHLEYTSIAAYLDGGDYWKTRKNGVVDPDIDPEIYCLYHKLTLSF